MSDKKLKQRCEVKNEFKWDTACMYESSEAWEKDFNKASGLLKEFGKHRDSVKTSAAKMLECLKDACDIEKIVEKVYVYSHLRLHEDSRVSEFQSMSDRAQSLYVDTMAAVSFIMPAILSADKEIIEELLVDTEGRVYKQYVEDILRQREHVLSEEMEEFLAKTEEIASSPKNIFSMLNNADIKFPEVHDDKGELIELTKGRYVSLLESEKAEVRKEAFETLADTYLKQKNTLAATLYASNKRDVFFSKMRKFDSSVNSALFETNVPREVYTNLIDVVHENLPLMYKYVALRKKQLGVDELHMYDLYTPIVPNVKMEVSFQEAKDIILKGLQPLGEEYGNLLRQGFENRWIDVYENEGKESGAYSWGAYSGHPYVLMNYQDTLDNMFTLAHEMGHALHSYYTWQTQPYVYANYKTFVAEVASTVNEALVMEYMLKNTEDAEVKKYLINNFLEQFKGTLYRQTMFAEFELITHTMVEEGKPLNFEVLSEKYYELVKKYFGDGIVADERIKIEWARIPHFYNAFYVYQYATGYSAAIALSRRILNEGAPAVADYIEFLKSGSSDYAINILKRAGVDMASPDPIRNALALFGELLERFEKL